MEFSKRKNYKFIITSGPTREFIDPIRYLSNPSTGRMGHSIARAALNRGFQVSYICGPVNKSYRTVENAKNINIISTIDMLGAVQDEMCDNAILVMSAAPADYRPREKSKNKLKKVDAPVLTLIPNPDILKTISTLREKQTWQNVIIVGFAAETNNIEEYAKEKLINKKLDIIFLNDVSSPKAGFGVDTNELIYFTKDGDSSHWSIDTKERIGHRIVEKLESLIKV